MILTGQSHSFNAITEDGTLSLVSAEHGELYHNLIGAYTEALCNYSQVAFKVWRIVYGEKLPDCLNVLDCCFGLGYNSFVLAQQLPSGIDLNVTGIELDPTVLGFVPQVLAQSCFSQLRLDGVGPQEAQDLSQFQVTTIKRNSTKGSLSFNLIRSCLRAYLQYLPQEDRHHFDLVLHDPFSPKKMPELWTIDLFERYKQRLADGGMIITYSSAPAVRGALLDLGFYVYRTPTLGGKWGGTLAVSTDVVEKHVTKGDLDTDLAHLSQEEQKRLAKSSRVPYRDPALEAERDQIVLAREAEQKTFKKNH